MKSPKKKTIKEKNIALVLGAATSQRGPTHLSMQRMTMAVVRETRETLWPMV